MIDQTAGESTIRAFYERVADPDVFSGGGSVASVAAAGAAATALLVMRLNASRSRNAPHRAQIDQAIDRTTSAIEYFYQAADHDISVLDELLEAQREMKGGGGHGSYRAALRRAAESPLALAERIVQFLEVIESQIPLTSRFTVSDLGAAAVLAEGACRAALLTAEVNIALLRDVEGADPDVIALLEQRRLVALETVSQAATGIEDTTRRIIAKRKKGQAVLDDGHTT